MRIDILVYRGIPRFWVFRSYGWQDCGDRWTVAGKRKCSHVLLASALRVSIVVRSDISGTKSVLARTRAVGSKEKQRSGQKENHGRILPSSLFDHIYWR